MLLFRGIGFIIAGVPSFRSVAQPGRALRSGRRGRWFEPSHSDHRLQPANVPIFLFYIWWVLGIFSDIIIACF